MDKKHPVQRQEAGKGIPGKGDIRVFGIQSQLGFQRAGETEGLLRRILWVLR